MHELARTQHVICGRLPSLGILCCQLLAESLPPSSLELLVIVYLYLTDFPAPILLSQQDEHVLMLSALTMLGHGTQACSHGVSLQEMHQCQPTKYPEDLLII